MDHNIKAVEFAIASEVKVDESGKATFSIRAVARLANIDFSGLAKTLKTGVELEPSNLATFLIGQGFEGVELSKFSLTGIPDLAATSTRPDQSGNFDP